jgi:hypothetical protein
MQHPSDCLFVCLVFGVQFVFDCNRSDIHEYLRIEKLNGQNFLDPSDDGFLVD